MEGDFTVFSFCQNKCSRVSKNTTFFNYYADRSGETSTN